MKTVATPSSNPMELFATLQIKIIKKKEKMILILSMIKWKRT